MSNMKRKFTEIECMFDQIHTALFRMGPSLDYSQVTTRLMALSNLIGALDNDSDSNNELLWSVGEFTECDLQALIIGAYWHYTEWHAGQASISYRTLCALGNIFSPGMSGIEEENEAYQALQEMAEAEQ